MRLIVRLLEPSNRYSTITFTNNKGVIYNYYTDDGYSVKSSHATWEAVLANSKNIVSYGCGMLEVLLLGQYTFY